jgi:hypothetical protein
MAVANDADEAAMVVQPGAMLCQPTIRERLLVALKKQRQSVLILASPFTMLLSLKFTTQVQITLAVGFHTCFTKPYCHSNFGCQGDLELTSVPTDGTPFRYTVPQTPLK